MVKTEEPREREKVMSTIRETEVWSGYPVPSLYKLAARGVPGFVRNGRNIRVHRAIFERWLEEQARGSLGDAA